MTKLHMGYICTGFGGLDSTHAHSLVGGLVSGNPQVSRLDVKTLLVFVCIPVLLGSFIPSPTLLEDCRSAIFVYLWALHLFPLATG